MDIFFSVGEPSGDLHGANLIRELQSRQQVNAIGFGGPRMKAAGLDQHFDLTQLATMFLDGLAKNLPTFLKLRKQAEEVFRRQRPAAVVLIDYPGFNWWIAKAAKQHGVPVIYYGLPQLWAWRPGRIRKLKRLADLALCKLPFEPQWFNRNGCRSIYVGHPYFDELVTRPIDRQFIQAQFPDASERLLTLLPGSRDSEITRNLPDMLRAAALLRGRHPGLKIAIACFNAAQAKRASELMQEQRISIPVHVGQTPELIERATCCLACSGSVSLELMFHRKPTVILYRVSQLKYQLGRALLQSRFISLPNLMACRDIRRTQWTMLDPEADDVQAEMPMPEYLSTVDRSRDVARRLSEWLDDPAKLAQRRDWLQTLTDRFAQPGASGRAASLILDYLDVRHRCQSQSSKSATGQLENWFAAQLANQAQTMGAQTMGSHAA